MRSTSRSWCSWSGSSSCAPEAGPPRGLARMSSRLQPGHPRPRPPNASVMDRRMVFPDVTELEAVLAGSPDPEIVALEAELRTAQLTADVPALDRLIAAELLFTGPDGQLGTKAHDLEAHGSGVVRFRSHVPEELRVRRVGADVAVTALRARPEVEVAGTLVRGTYRYTRVWAREADGKWRVVGGHVSEVPGQPSR